MMQKRLSQIAQIPLIIQTALESVSKAFEQFMPDEDELAEAADELQQTRDALADLSLDDDKRSAERRCTVSEEYASDTHDDDDDGELLSNNGGLTEEECNMCADVEAADGSTITATESELEVGCDPNMALFEAEREREQVAELELQRAQKLEKINKLDLSWPWGNMEKKIHRWDWYFDVFCKDTGLRNN